MLRTIDDPAISPEYIAAVIAEITTARQGIQNTDINNWIDGAITDIQKSTTIEDVDSLKNEILEVINIFQDGKAEGIEKGKAEALGEMGEPCDDCPAVKVTKGNKTVILYLPNQVEMLKVPANN